MPITWRNITAPTFAGSNDLIDSGNKSIQQGISSAQGAFDSYIDRAEKKTETGIQGLFDSIKTEEAYNNAVSDGSLSNEGLSSAFGSHDGTLANTLRNTSLNLIRDRTAKEEAYQESKAIKELSDDYYSQFSRTNSVSEAYLANLQAQANLQGLTEDAAAEFINTGMAAGMASGDIKAHTPVADRTNDFRTNLLKAGVGPKTATSESETFRNLMTRNRGLTDPQKAANQISARDYDQTLDLEAKQEQAAIALATKTLDTSFGAIQALVAQGTPESSGGMKNLWGLLDVGDVGESAHAAVNELQSKGVKLPNGTYHPLTSAELYAVTKNAIVDKQLRPDSLQRIAQAYAIDSGTRKDLLDRQVALDAKNLINIKAKSDYVTKLHADSKFSNLSASQKIIASLGNPKLTNQSTAKATKAATENGVKLITAAGKKKAAMTELTNRLKVITENGEKSIKDAVLTSGSGTAPVIEGGGTPTPMADVLAKLSDKALSEPTEVTTTPDGYRNIYGGSALPDILKGLGNAADGGKSLLDSTIDLNNRGGKAVINSIKNFGPAISDSISNRAASARRRIKGSPEYYEAQRARTGVSAEENDDIDSQISSQAGGKALSDIVRGDLTLENPENVSKLENLLRTSLTAQTRGMVEEALKRLKQNIT